MLLTRTITQLLKGNVNKASKFSKPAMLWNQTRMHSGRAGRRRFHVGHGVLLAVGGVIFASELEGSRQSDDNDKNEATWKVINDPVHGLMKIHPLLDKIINTPEFQRLGNIKQLGAVHLVYPAAKHSRFEHSIGVSHLAGMLLESLRRNQPDLPINDKDVLCVKIAGLCHDLGHGPYSHLFDDQFLPLVGKKPWKHEEGSVLMLRHLIEKNGLMEEFKKWGLDEWDIMFIEEQITGPNDKQSNGMQEWMYKGRGREKSFLYEVVANKRNGIDVDKWEYLARDCYMLGIKSNFDHLRCMQFVRVLDVNGERQICSRDKEADNLYDMFHTRSNLHRRACKHRVVRIIDHMLLDAMEKANDYITFEGKGGKRLKMSETITDMEAFCKLTDNVFPEIYNSKDKNLKEAQRILQNIYERKLYRSVGEMKLTEEQIKTLGDEPKAKIREKVIAEMKWNPRSFLDGDVVVDVTSFDYSMKDKNPMDRLYCYKKEDQNKAIKHEQVSHMLTKIFSEKQIFVFYKKRDNKEAEKILKMLKKAFAKWRDETFPKDN